jgi:hypothetical protein
LPVSTRVVIAQSDSPLARTYPEIANMSESPENLPSASSLPTLIWIDAESLAAIRRLVQELNGKLRLNLITSEDSGHRSTERKAVVPKEKYVSHINRNTQSKARHACFYTFKVYFRSIQQPSAEKAATQNHNTPLLFT